MPEQGLKHQAISTTAAKPVLAMPLERHCEEVAISKVAAPFELQKGELQSNGKRKSFTFPALPKAATSPSKLQAGALQLAQLRTLSKCLEQPVDIAALDRPKAVKRRPFVPFSPRPAHTDPNVPTAGMITSTSSACLRKSKAPANDAVPTAYLGSEKIVSGQRQSLAGLEEGQVALALSSPGSMPLPIATKSRGGDAATWSCSRGKGELCRGQLSATMDCTTQDFKTGRKSQQQEWEGELKKICLLRKPALFLRNQNCMR